MQNWTFPDFAYQGLWLVLMLSMPTMLVAAAVGLFTSILQAATQINDQSIGQVLKLIAVVLTVAISARWSALHVYTYADELMNFVGIVKPNES
jgi:type III secretion protein S